MCALVTHNVTQTKEAYDAQQDPKGHIVLAGCNGICVHADGWCLFGVVCLRVFFFFLVWCLCILCLRVCLCLCVCSTHTPPLRCVPHKYKYILKLKNKNKDSA